MFTNTKFLNNYTKILITIPLLLSIFAEPSLFSLFYNNITPVRVVFPLLLIIGYLAYFKKINLSILKKSGLNLILLSLLLFNIVNILTIFVTLDIKNYIGINAFWFSLLLYLLLIKTLKIYKFKALFFKTFLITSTLMILLSSISFSYYLYNFLFNGYWGPIKVATLISDENHYAYYVLFLIFINLYMLNTKILKITPYIYYLILFVLSAIFLGLQSRSAMLGLFCGTVVYIFFNLYKKHLIIKPLFVILAGLTFGTWFFKPYVTTQSPNYSSSGFVKDNLVEKDSKYSVDKSETVTFVENIIINSLPKELNEASVKSHISLLYISFLAGINNPILGVGVGSFNEYVVNNPSLFSLYAKYDPQAAYSGVFPAHSMYGQAFAESGVFGFAFYLLFLFSVLLYLLKKLFLANNENNFRLVVCTLIIFVGYLVFTITYNLHEEWFWIPFFTLIVFVDQQSNKTQKSLN